MSFGATGPLISQQALNPRGSPESKTEFFSPKEILNFRKIFIFFLMNGALGDLDKFKARKTILFIIVNLQVSK